jgi:hypothetical protein
MTAQSLTSYIFRALVVLCRSWQWSERYFVLTQTALHYFKRGQCNPLPCGTCTLCGRADTGKHRHCILRLVPCSHVYS